MQNLKKRTDPVSDFEQLLQQRYVFHTLSFLFIVHLFYTVFIFMQKCQWSE